MTFQKRVQNWLMACFSMEICRDTIERNHRFLEESLELVQSLGCTQSEAHQLVDYVYGRPVGDPAQEVGGVLNTLAALCSAADLDMDECGEIELARVWTKIDKIRAKQAAKPKHSPLPEHAAPTTSDFLAGMRALYRAYVSTLESGRDRIIDFGGSCDPVSRMEEGDPALIAARALIAQATGATLTPQDGSGA